MAAKGKKIPEEASPHPLVWKRCSTVISKASSCTTEFLFDLFPSPPPLPLQQTDGGSICGFIVLNKMTAILLGGKHTHSQSVYLSSKGGHSSEGYHGNQPRQWLKEKGVVWSPSLINGNQSHCSPSLSHKRFLGWLCSFCYQHLWLSPAQKPMFWKQNVILTVRKGGKTKPLNLFF